MKPMTHIVIHIVIVLLMDGIIMKISDSPFCWGSLDLQDYTAGTVFTVSTGPQGHR